MSQPATGIVRDCDILQVFRLRLADVLRTSAALDPVLRSALIAACLADSPPRTIKGLCLRAGISRPTLWRHWRKCSLADRLSIRQFLELLGLLADLQGSFDSRRSPISSDLRRKCTKLLGSVPVDQKHASFLVEAWLADRTVSPRAG